MGKEKEPSKRRLLLCEWPCGVRKDTEYWKTNWNCLSNPKRHSKIKLFRLKLTFQTEMCMPRLFFSFVPFFFPSSFLIVWLTRRLAGWTADSLCFSLRWKGCGKCVNTTTSAKLFWNHIYIYKLWQSWWHYFSFQLSIWIRHPSPLRIQKQPGVYAETVSHIVCLA